MKKVLGATLLMFLMAVGSGVGFLAVKELEDEKQENIGNVSSQSKVYEELEALRKDLSVVQKQVGILREEVMAFTGQPSKAPVVAKTTQLPKADPSLLKRLEKLETTLADISRPISQLDVAELMQKFNDALLAKDSKTCLETMVALTKLDPPEFQAFMQCYGDMHEVEWLGLDRRSRRGWASKELYSWALTAPNLGIKDEPAKEFLQVALFSLRRYESDSAKRTEILAAFLANQPLPKARPASEEGGQRRGRRGRGGRGGFGGFGGSGDLYRDALSQLSRDRSESTSVALGTVLSNRGNPTDVRLTALRGLGRQKDAGATTAIQAATSDPDEEVAKQAALMVQANSSPVSGTLITTVTPDSEGAKAGLVAGQVITAINGKPVKSMRDLMGVMRRVSGDTLAVSIYHNGASSVVNVKNTGRIGINGQTVTSAADKAAK